MFEPLTLVGGAYAVVSVVTLFVFEHDKRCAGEGGRRVPEGTLHVLELLGGWPGSYIGQHVFKHKTRKPSYQVVFWLIVAIHLAGWLCYAGVLRF